MLGISVIIPTYNREEKIVSRAIKSVLLQAQQAPEIKIEIILSNNSQIKIDPLLLKKFPEIKILDSSKIPGVSYARNNGAKYSQYEYLSFLDDDDYWSNGFIRSMHQKITSEKTDMVICGFKNIDDAGDIKKGKIIKESIKISDALIYNPGFTGSNFIINKKNIIKLLVLMKNY